MTADSDYEGVTHAGLCLVRYDGGVSVLLAQRAYDETDDPAVRETWEFPGGHLEPGEEPFEGAEREFREEIGVDLPLGDVVNGWRSENGVYQGFVYEPTGFPAIDSLPLSPEVQAVAWVTPEEAQKMDLRPEMAEFDWSLVEVSGNEDEMAAAEQDTTDYSAIFAQPIPIHGVVAPEEVATGDKRGFNAGSMTKRDYRLPFRWQETDTGEHNGARVVGSVDRMMRKDGLIHWSGLLMPSPKADEFAGVMEFFGGRYGVSVDGDNGSIDMDRSKRENMAWFEAVRASGLTAVDIPAFAEAYVAFGPHPDMPEEDDDEFSVMVSSGDLVAFNRGPGWVTNPGDTKRIHDYWMPGHPGGDKIQWGTPGDFRRAKALIGEKIAKNSPEKVRFLNQIIAQWHHDALGYWPGDLGKPGNAPDTPENRRRAARHAAASNTDIALDDEGLGWEAVLTAGGKRALPPARYFTEQPEHSSLFISDPDENGYRHTYGMVGEYGVCHIGFSGKCVEIPQGDDFRDFHLGRTKVSGNTGETFIASGVLTYKVDHRSAAQILSETAEQQHFDNIAHAWAAVRVGYNEDGIWFSGVVLPKVDEDDLTLIQATGQVSGEWRSQRLRACQAVNTPGFAVHPSDAVINEDGEVLALVASAHNLSGCAPSPAERMAALRDVFAEEQAIERIAALRAKVNY